MIHFVAWIEKNNKYICSYNKNMAMSGLGIV